MIWIEGLGLAFVLLATGAVGLAACGARRWAAAARALLGRIEAARLPASTRLYSARELDGLPAPVQRYFRTVLQEGQPVIAAATIEHAGTFNMSATAEQWKPFTSRQRIATRGPAFLWDARIALMPGLSVRVHDGYVCGEGILHAAVLGLYTVARSRGGGELARGELMRFLAEAPWYPTALLPSQGVRWEAVDDRSANASLADGPLALTLLFGFDDAGLIDSVRAEARGAMAGSEIVMVPWECRLSDYQLRDGITVPTAGEAAWLRPEGRKPYFRGAITSVAYEFAS